jgi:hypothetical protein
VSAPRLSDAAGRKLAAIDSSENASDPRERARFVRAALSSRRRRALATPLIGALMATLSLGTAWIALRAHHEPLHVTVRAGKGTFEEGHLRLRAVDAPASMAFSDGSEVELEGGAAHVDEVTAKGATVTLEEGTASVHVVHRADTRWTVRAGPYAVAVTGTRFDIGWSPRLGLRIAMREGSVHVDGPALGTGVDVRDAVTFEAGKPAETPVADVPAPAPDSVDPLPDRARAEIDPRRVAPSPGWPELVRLGHYGTVIDQAEREGLERALDRRGAEDVWAIADAARLGGRGALADRALRAMRSRFPRSPRAATAAFLLGRGEEDAGHTPAAVAFYERYLEEAPGGALAAEAAGRRMSVLRASGNGEAARRAAEEYLTRFPSGTYAALAREIASP